jgi:O-acetyl-ADP-ribose deacetylase (regulator of RNase III)
VIKQIFEMRVSPVQVIQICQGDITEETVDAIVNAANGRLAHGGGVAGAIARKAGSALVEQSRDWIREHGTVETGEVAVTDGGDLPCAKVIHAVGPVWQDGNHGEPDLLERAVFNSLAKADELRLQSISIPAISSGIFGFPKGLCAEISLKTGIRFFRTHPESPLTLIRYTNIDSQTASLFREKALLIQSVR